MADINAGTALGPTEPFEDGTAAQTYRRRTGLAPTANVLQLDIAAVQDINKKLLFGAVPEVSARPWPVAGWNRAVVGNGDLGVEGLPVLEGLAAAPAPLPAAPLAVARQRRWDRRWFPRSRNRTSPPSRSPRSTDRWLWR